MLPTENYFYIITKNIFEKKLKYTVRTIKWVEINIIAVYISSIQILIFVFVIFKIA
jgi:hypothetical protein